MPRKKRPLDRDGHVVRDASLVIIACEDTYAVKQYFARFYTRRVQFKVLPTEDCRSSPQEVLVRLNEFKEQHATEEGDSFWLCIDTDHWVEENHIGNLKEVLRQCRQKGYGLAISKPCFELWLLLHFCDWPGFVEPLPSQANSCSEVEESLRRTVGSYRKKSCDRLPIAPDRVRLAAERAKQMDIQPEDVLPSYPFTRVYRLIDLLTIRETIRLSR